MNDWDIEDTRQPKDEPEAEYCETCGQEIEYTECDNKFCPDKFSAKVVVQMAEHLVEVEQELSDLKVKFKMAENLENYRANQVRELHEKLTQSQQGE